MAEELQQSAEAFEDTARKHLRAKRYEEAVSAYQSAIALDGDNADLHEALGTACFLAKDTQGAAAAFEKVTRLDPMRASAWVNWGAVLNRLGDYGKAAEVLRKAITRDRKCAKAYYNLGIAQKGLKQLSMAVNAYKEAIRIDPQMAEAHQNLGNAQAEMQNHGQAVLSFEKALELRPDFAKAQRGLEQSKSAVSDAKKAESPFGRLVDETALAARAEIRHRKALSVAERNAEREMLRDVTKVTRSAVRHTLAVLRDELSPGLHGLNRVLLQNETGSAMTSTYNGLVGSREALETHFATIKEALDQVRELLEAEDANP